MKVQTAPVVAFAALLVAAGAPPAEDVFSRPGIYTGMGLAVGGELFEDQIGDALGVDVDVDTSLGPNARIGYRVRPWLAGVDFQLARFDAHGGLLGDEHDVGFAGRPAVGVDVYLTRRWYLNAELAGVLPVSDFGSQFGSAVHNLFALSGSFGFGHRF